MRLFSKLPLLALPVLIACGGAVGIGGSGGGMAVDLDDKYRRDVDEWHQGRIQRLTREDGWLSLVGLFPLPGGTHRLGSGEDCELRLPAKAPALAGTITVADTVVTLVAEPGAGMVHDGAPVDRVVLATDRSGTPTEIQLGSIRFFVIDRPGNLYLRVKDTASPVRANFKGIDRFPVREKWRVEAVLDRYDPPRRLTVPNVLGYEEVVNCPGALVFRLDGKEYRLEPMSQEGTEWFIVFGDATSGHETYGGGRFVYVPAPGPDGRTVIDFNRAYNPPCVFTEFATCPLPHRENVLPVRIEAGEKMWEGGAHH